MLERLGCRVLVARDGREAVDVFRTHARTIDAVLIDLTLPRLSGDQAAREIQRIRADAPLILMSGCGEERVTREVAEAGRAAFLRKPFSVADLRSTMGRALAARGDASV
jgi:CheY-like chemotaxis protein